MLPLFWDETHHALRAEADRWVARHITPHAERFEEEPPFDEALYASAGAAGLLGVAYPEGLDGGGGDIFHALVVAEALVRGQSVGTAVGLGSHCIALPPILALGTAEQQARFVPPVVRGEHIAALAVTEPGAGSDVAGIRTRAVRDGDHYVITGSKTYITSGQRAHRVTLLARTSEDRHGGLSLFVVDTASPGFSRGKLLKKMGWWASDTAELHLDGVRVPVADRLGEEGAGFYGLMANFVHERLFLAATCVAIARLALEETERYVQEREAFGKPIGRFQVVRHTIAEMRTREAQARSFTSTVAERVRRGEDVRVDVAMAKNAAVDACSYVTDRAVQLHGGMGYMRECLVERLYRDARLFPIGGGTTEIMRDLISRWG